MRTVGSFVAYTAFFLYGTVAMGKKIALLTGLVLAFPWAMPAAAQSMPVPAEVKQYVAAHNFVAAFSTPQERLALARYDAPADVQRGTGSERLKTVFVHARLREALHVDIDPGMPNPIDQAPKWDPPLGVLQVERVQSTDGSRMFVEVRRYSLDPETVAQFIASYDEDAAPPRIDAAFRGTPRRVVQVWTRVDGRWRMHRAQLYDLDL